MDEQTYNALLNILDYCEEEERKHWEESDMPVLHVYRSIQQVRAWADEVSNDYNND